MRGSNIFLLNNLMYFKRVSLFFSPLHTWKCFFQLDRVLRHRTFSNTWNIGNMNFIFEYIQTVSDSAGNIHSNPLISSRNLECFYWFGVFWEFKFTDNAGGCLLRLLLCGRGDGSPPPRPPVPPLSTAVRGVLFPPPPPSL